ncbi:MAG: ImmA/IrrE family metallo-endopeptidase [Planctomycetota bacterium]
MRNKLDVTEQKALEVRAHRLASELLERLGLMRAPVDPLAVAEAEAPILKVRSGNFKRLFDGRLEYHPKQNLFLLFYNTKYESSYPGRTRFSIGHELAHYFLPEHRSYLLGGGEAHSSRTEFQSVATSIEREADAFSAGLLLPRKLIYPRVGSQELSPEFLADMADDFKTSLIATSMRAVQVSPFPSAAMMLRKGKVVWRQVSDPLISAGWYPRKGLHSIQAQNQWKSMVAGAPVAPSAEVKLTDWFDAYGETTEESTIATEYYMPMPRIETLLVVVCADEDDLFSIYD